MYYILAFSWFLHRLRCRANVCNIAMHVARSSGRSATTERGTAAAHPVASLLVSPTSQSTSSTSRQVGAMSMHLAACLRPFLPSFARSIVNRSAQRPPPVLRGTSTLRSSIDTFTLTVVASCENSRNKNTGGLPQGNWSLLRDQAYRCPVVESTVAD